MSEPPVGCPRRGTPSSRALANQLLALVGWRVVGSLPNEPRFVLIVAPHTSNWDFGLCIMAMFAIGLRLHWLGKHTIFFWPATPILRWLGGEPIDRGAALGTVDTAIERFGREQQWVLGLSPEGTRRKTDAWKSGFYRIAVGAGVPILPVAVDYRRRAVVLGTLTWPSADLDTGVAALRAHFRHEMARHPTKFSE